MSKAANPFTDLPVDDRDKPMQVGREFSTIDDANVNSPQNYTTAVSQISIPDRAVEVVFFPSTDLRISERANMAGYDIISSGTKEILPCAYMETIFYRADSSNGSLRYRFILV